MGFISNILKRPGEVKSGTFSHSFSLFVWYSFIYLFLSKFTFCPLNICLKLRRQFIIEEPDSYTAFKKREKKKTPHTLLPLDLTPHSQTDLEKISSSRFIIVTTIALY